MRGRRWLALGVGLAGILVLSQVDLQPGVPSAAVRGASLGLFASDADYDYDAMLEEMADRGARDVLVVYRVMQTDVYATSLARVPGLSPSLQTLARTLAQARVRGLRVGLMPIVGLESAEAGQWRGELAPAALDPWFESYEANLLEAARLAQASGAARLVIGSELSSLEPHETRWRALAQKLRPVFDGQLLYSANWDRYRAVPFWDAVDAIGVSAYFDVSGDGDVRETWGAHLSEIERFAAGREVVLTEVGYPAHADAAQYPWDPTRGAPLDLGLQGALLAAFCEAYEEAPGGGYYVWNWFGVGGPRDRGYALRGKPAAARFEACMRSSERSERDVSRS